LDKTSEPKDINIWKCGNVYSDKMAGKDMKKDSVIRDEDPRVQVQKSIRLHESNELKKSEEQGDFVPVHKTIKNDDFEELFLRFYHLSGNTDGEYIDAIMSLEIPITEIKVDIDSAIEIAKKEDFGAEVIISFNDPNKKYLDIYMNIYVKSYMQTAIQKLKNIAREILKED